MKTRLVSWLKLLNGFLLKICSTGINKELARRDGQRGRGVYKWFTPEEATVAEALANIIVPTDETTPGMEDICFLGPAAVVVLDNLIAKSEYRKHLYSRGLLAFDTLARRAKGCGFSEIPVAEQTQLFRTAQLTHEQFVKAFIIKRTWLRLSLTVRASDGLLFASELYPVIRSDSFQVFYTSGVCWTWLEYDGPPMDEGYKSVLAPRER